MIRSFDHQKLIIRHWNKFLLKISLTWLKDFLYLKWEKRNFNVALNVELHKVWNFHKKHRISYNKVIMSLWIKWKVIWFWTEFNLFILHLIYMYHCWLFSLIGDNIISAIEPFFSFLLWDGQSICRIPWWSFFYRFHWSIVISSYSLKCFHL